MPNSITLSPKNVCFIVVCLKPFVQILWFWIRFPSPLWIENSPTWNPHQKLRNCYVWLGFLLAIEKKKNMALPSFSRDHLNPELHLEPPFAQLPRLLVTAPSAGHVSNADPQHLTSDQWPVLVTGMLGAGDSRSWKSFKFGKYISDSCWITSNWVCHTDILVLTEGAST